MSKTVNQILKPIDRYAVHLNIYDMNTCNSYMEILGLGVYHSGLEVFGLEYSFGGHPFNGTGIFSLKPKSAGEEFKDSFIYKQTVFLGFTEIDKKVFEKLLDALGENRFCGTKYHLFFNNCNHFTDKLSQVLCGESIPRWVNRMARISSNIPLLEAILPQPLLVPTLTMAPNTLLEESEEIQKNFIV